MPDAVAGTPQQKGEDQATRHREEAQLAIETITGVEDILDIEREKREGPLGQHEERGHHAEEEEPPPAARQVIDIDQTGEKGRALPWVSLRDVVEPREVDRRQQEEQRANQDAQTEVGRSRQRAQRMHRERPTDDATQAKADLALSEEPTALALWHAFHDHCDVVRIAGPCQKHIPGVAEEEEPDPRADCVGRQKESRRCHRQVAEDA